MLKVPNILVDCNWLFQHLDHPDLIVLDATIPKVTASKIQVSLPNQYIPQARFFDIKTAFSNLNAVFPNTMLSSDKFEEIVQILGIYKTSCIVVYDQHGIYSSPRAWFMFRNMGFDNIAVLNGGLPRWIEEGYETLTNLNTNFKRGNFEAGDPINEFVSFKYVLDALEKQNDLTIDARSEGRFFGTSPEPRDGVRSGHIPNSKSLPYASLLKNDGLKSKKEIKDLFKNINPKLKPMIFSCGTGITACVLAFSAELAGLKEYKVYDGSWTEWGSSLHLPVEV